MSHNRLGLAVKKKKVTLIKTCVEFYQLILGNLSDKAIKENIGKTL